MAGATKVMTRNQNLNNKDKKENLEDLKKIVNTMDDQENEEQIRIKEQSILELGQHFSQEGRAIELGNLIKNTRPFLNQISKAKASKLVRALVDLFLDMEAKTGMEVELCIECIEWAKQEKRTFLRQSLEARLVALYYDTHNYLEALQLGSTLLKELKKMDDKNLLVEVQLLESKVYHALSNLPKARAALTSARTTANAIYCPPKLQAALDLQSGILHAADEKDFKTAFSYFYEAFEGYDSIDNSKAVIALKYMLLSKIMLNLSEEVNSIVMGKLALKYAGPEIDAMKAIAKASHKRSMADFQLALLHYKKELVDDPIIKAHLNTLYDTMLEQNLCRIIEPYSRVQVGHVAKIINLPLDNVEKKLSQMILDKKFNAEIVHFINLQENIEGKLIADLGSGCGMLAIAAAYLDAGLSIGFEIDEDALKLSEQNRQNAECENVNFVRCNVLDLFESRWHQVFDIVIMNPPFGTCDTKGFDMCFVQTALSLAKDSVYSLHKLQSINHIEKVCQSWNVKMERLMKPPFKIPATLGRHKIKNKSIKVVLLRFTKQFKNT